MAKKERVEAPLLTEKKAKQQNLAVESRIRLKKPAK
jgi:hypothetical protein